MSSRIASSGFRRPVVSWSTEYTGVSILTRCIVILRLADQWLSGGSSGRTGERSVPARERLSTYRLTHCDPSWNFTVAVIQPDPS